MNFFYLNVSVTKDNIKHGERGNCGKCPVTLAVFEALAKLDIEQQVMGDAVPWEVQTGAVSVMICKNVPYGEGYVNTKRRDPIFHADLPYFVTRFIHDFDCGRLVSPFTLALRFDKC